jgi:PAS domain S-box-containing protein
VKSKEIESKARHEQALLDATLQANKERLRAEQELRRAEQRQAAIIQSLPMVLYLERCDAHPRRPNYVSGDLQAVTGFTHDQVLDEPNIWADRLHPEDRDRVIAAMEARRKSGRSSVEYRWRCADGSYKHFLDQAVLLKDADGKPVEFAGTLTDISEQRSLETQLIQAQKMDAIGKLTGGIAHDFNNLLAAVIGGLSLLEKKAALKDDQRRILGMTKRAAEQGSELVRRLLAFARRQKLEPRPIDLQSLRDAVSDLLTHTLGGLVHIDWRIGKASWDVLADRAQLELALVNLIINARDAMPDGGTIVITTENAKAEAGNESGVDSGDYVRIAIADTGSGIAPEDLEKVMDPFFTTKAIGKGSGLGLSMVYGFARQSNGAFRIDSALGEGTTAELWLPRASERAPREVPPPAAKKRKGPPRKLSILLVDDHAHVRSTTAAVLSDFGHKVVEAADGTDALRVLREDCGFDLLITDYAMPHLSGTDLLRAAQEICPEVPALIVTGYAEAEAIRDRPQHVEILQKPFTPEALEGAIAQLCRNPVIGK